MHQWLRVIHLNTFLGNIFYALLCNPYEWGNIFNAMLYNTFRFQVWCLDLERVLANGGLVR